MPAKRKVGRPPKLTFAFIQALNFSVAKLLQEDPSLTQKAALEELARSNLIPRRYLDWASFNDSQRVAGETEDPKLQMAKDEHGRHFLEQYLTPRRINKVWKQDAKRNASLSKWHSMDTGWVKDNDQRTGILQVAPNLEAWKEKNPDQY